jgi:hypothetical protein
VGVSYSMLLIEQFIFEEFGNGITGSPSKVT